MYKLEQEKQLAKTFTGLTHMGGKNKDSNRLVNQNLLDIPLTNTEAYGTSSGKMRYIKDWNKFKKFVNKLNHGKLSCVKVKSLLTSQMLQVILKMKRFKTY